MKDFSQVMFVIVDCKGNVLPHTIRLQRKMCINDFLNGSKVTWEEAHEAAGWIVKKVDVNIRDCSNFASWA